MPWPRGRGRGESLTSPRRIEAKIRAAQACRLRAQGHTFRYIAAQLGYNSRFAAWRAVDRTMQATLGEYWWDVHRGKILSP